MNHYLFNCSELFNIQVMVVIRLRVVDVGGWSRWAL